MQLDHEKFQGAKELAEISMKISASTALLSQLKADEEEYLTEREKKAVVRIQKALADSEGLIRAIGQNHDELVRYRNELTDYHETLRCLIQSVNECKVALEEATEGFNKEMEAHEKKVTKFTNEIKKERSLIEAERATLARDRVQLERDKKLLKDRQDMLLRAAEELKAKTTKHG